MLSDNLENKLNRILFNMLTDSDKEAIPRIIMIEKNNEEWKKTITRAIHLDEKMFKGHDYIITCRRYSNDTEESINFKGELQLALHNALASVNSTDSMIITVENVIYNCSKGRRLQKSIKFLYFILNQRE